MYGLSQSSDATFMLLQYSSITLAYTLRQEMTSQNSHTGTEGIAAVVSPVPAAAVCL